MEEVGLLSLSFHHLSFPFHHLSLLFHHLSLLVHYLTPLHYFDPQPFFCAPSPRPGFPKTSDLHPPGKINESCGDSWRKIDVDDGEDVDDDGEDGDDDGEDEDDGESNLAIFG